MDLSLIVVVVIVTALAFDFTNGFHDTANAMATSIATKAVGWLLTLPAAAIVGAVAAWLAGTGTVGTIIVALVLVGLAGGIYAASRRRPITADNVNDVPAPKPVAVAA